MTAILWWSLPRDLGEEPGQNTVIKATSQFLELLLPEGETPLPKFFQRYIDLTGNQQYWDFFAPQSPKYHQYLSVCPSIEDNPLSGKISCRGQPGFSNLDPAIAAGLADFKVFGSDRSRYYRLTENLSKQENMQLRESFARYYGANRHHQNGGQPSYLVLHEFELHPELADLPKAGYRMDSILLTLP